MTVHDNAQRVNHLCFRKAHSTSSLPYARPLFFFGIILSITGKMTTKHC